EEALEVLDQALSADPAYAVAHDNRGMILYDCRRFLDAAQAHLTALAHTPVEAAADRVAILLHLAKAAFEAAEFDASEQASRAILELEPDNADALEHLATVLARLLRQDEAIVLLNRLARLQGLTTGGCQDGSAEATILLLGGVGAGHVPTRYLFDPALFATRTMILLSPDQPDAPLGDVPYDLLIDADVIFNTLGEVDKDGGQIGPADALVARLGKPILNPSHRVARTSREQVHTLFGGIPGLRLPGVRWMTREELADLSELPAPRLIRPGGTHGGKDLVLLRTIADLAAYLAKVPNERFLLIDFFDFKGEHDCYRKFRMIFVDRKPYPYHLAIADSWLVHYWRAEMSRDEWKKREEEAFLTDWRQVFGPVGAAAVEEVGRRLDLDYGGMDCSILPNGEVLFFEANACMLVHLDDAEAEFPYKHRAVPRIRDAVTRMVRDRVAKARP
ncbi:MAG TPA: hypothetical protein VK558_00205, partial [Patescibacteria group bacterium]|nr:hypothetical protein [Patescibacteria group bacterium]